jgi:MFS family permease
MVKFCLYSLYLTVDSHLYTGNIIANQGFINKIGFPNAQGVFILNANYTALWGAMQSLGQLIGMLLLNPVSDKIGRKMTMYMLWIILCGVSFPPSICYRILLRDLPELSS